MKKHKTASSEHEYCNKCDINFETEEHLLIHKIKSNKHIVCPICGIDSGSEGGRDRHMRQVNVFSLSILTDADGAHRGVSSTAQHRTSPVSDANLHIAALLGSCVIPKMAHASRSVQIVYLSNNRRS
jgi:hypothetical protein